MKFKALAAVAVAGSLVLSVSMTAMAEEITGDVTETVDATFVGTHGGSPLTINGNVEVTSGDAINVYGVTVDVNGKVKTTDAGASAITAFSSTVKAESAENTAIVATVWAGSGGDVTVTGDVENSGTNVAVRAEDGATVTVGGNVTRTGGTDSAVYISNDSVSEMTTVTVFGKISGKIVLECPDNKNNYAVNVYQLREPGIPTLVEDAGIGDNVTDKATGSIHYIIRETSEVGGFELAEGTGTVGSVEDVAGKLYRTATAADDYTVTIQEVNGYTFKSITSVDNQAAVLTANGDGTYTLKVPKGGGVSLALVYEAIRQAQSEQADQEEQEEQKAAFTGSEGSAVTAGQWNMGPGGYWIYRNNGIFRDTWGYITLENGKTGWFWFDKNGVMAAGWKEIDGKWYYFNEVHDGTYGMMLSDTTTPDGEKVGADGVWIR